ncbi:MAG TPA: NAD(P)H-dependent oxidoreductase [Candidatus Nitrosocosmicus sp.]|nr:NAD(P)H-dependent oxidoreductase [Candidatus Nitrosocosmicus sp.]
MILKVLGVGSSMRSSSFSTETLRIALEKANQNGAETKLLNLYDNPLPFYHNVTNANTANIHLATELVAWADSFILATPDYHGSMSGSLKNFLDHFWSDFAGKTFGYICSSHEKGLTVMDHIRTTIRQCYGWSLPYGISINSSQDFNSNREITNTKLVTRLNSFSRDLVIYGSLIHEQFVKDLKSNINNTFASHYRK